MSREKCKAEKKERRSKAARKGEDKENKQDQEDQPTRKINYTFMHLKHACRTNVLEKMQQRSIRKVQKRDNYFAMGYKYLRKLSETPSIPLEVFQIRAQRKISWSEEEAQFIHFNAKEQCSNLYKREVKTL